MSDCAEDEPDDSDERTRSLGLGGNAEGVHDHVNGEVWQHSSSSSSSVASHRPQSHAHAHLGLNDSLGSSSCSSLAESLRRSTSGVARIHVRSHLRDKGGTSLVHGTVGTRQNLQGTRDRRWVGMGFNLTRLKPPVRCLLLSPMLWFALGFATGFSSYALFKAWHLTVMRQRPAQYLLKILENNLLVISGARTWNYRAG